MAAPKIDKLKEARKAALLARMKQGQSVSTGTRSYFKEGLEGVSFWSPKEGDHIIDVIPYIAGANDPQVKEGDPTYVLEIYIHPDVGGIENQTMICVEKTFKKPCSICEHRRALQKDGADEDLVKSLQPKRYPRSVYNIVCYDSEKDESKGVQIFDTNHYLFEMYLLKLAQGSGRAGQRPTGFVPFADPEEGRSIRFTRQGTMANTRYIAHAFEARNYTISKEILDSAHCLDQLIHIPTYEEVYNAYWGDTPPDEAQPRTVSESRTSKTRTATPAATPEPDEPGEPEETGEPEEPGETPDEAAALRESLEGMDRAQLKDFITEQNLPIQVYKEKEDGKYSAEWIREEILKALEIPAGESGETGEPDEPEAKPPVKPTGRKPNGMAPACPGGGVFGKDLNDLSHCEVCKIWDDCMTENERILKQQQAGKEKAKTTGTVPAAGASKSGRFAKK